MMRSSKRTADEPAPAVQLYTERPTRIRMQMLSLTDMSQNMRAQVRSARAYLAHATEAPPEHARKLDLALRSVYAAAAAAKPDDWVGFVGQHLLNAAKPPAETSPIGNAHSLVARHRLARAAADAAESNPQPAPAPTDHARGPSFVEQERAWCRNAQADLPKQLRLEVAAGAVNQIGPLLVKCRHMKQQAEELFQQLEVRVHKQGESDR